MELQNGQFVIGTLFIGEDYTEFWEERILGGYWNGKVYEITFLKYLQHRKVIPPNRISQFIAFKTDKVWAAIESGLYEKTAITEYYPTLTNFPRLGLANIEPNKSAIFEINYI